MHHKLGVSAAVGVVRNEDAIARLSYYRYSGTVI